MSPGWEHLGKKADQQSFLLEPHRPLVTLSPSCAEVATGALRAELIGPKPFCGCKRYFSCPLGWPLGPGQLRCSQHQKYTNE